MRARVALPADRVNIPVRIWSRCVNPLSNAELSRMIGDIYDCAVEPSRWFQTLDHIRDRLELAYVQLNFMSHDRSGAGGPLDMITFQTEWDTAWIDKLPGLLHTAPGASAWFEAGIDTPISQMQLVSEPEFRASEFCETWVKPQGLRDTCNTSLVKRKDLTGMLVAASYESRQLFDNSDREIFALPSPHVRRALMISGMQAENRFRANLHRNLLDKLATGIMILKRGGTLVYANASAEQLLSSGQNIAVKAGRVQASHLPIAKGFDEAVARACAENDTDIGLFGNGIPLPSREGAPAVCYVLPLGKSESRRALGPGLAALFISTEKAALPPTLEALSALTGLTSQESRIALMIAGGVSPKDGAEQLGISLNTIRSHITHIFQKTGTNDQQAVARLVSGLSLPVLQV
jgi:DNA-binding CsgD family transcriptional regulator/PAS domain-containing protein